MFKVICRRIIEIRIIILIILPVISCNCQTIDEEDWKLAKDKQDVQIYTHQMVNSKLNEFKGTVSIKTYVKNVISTLLDVENFRKWMVNVKSSSLLKKISEDEMYIYSEAKLPWPFNNRDIVNHINVYWSDGGDTATLVIDGVPDYIPEKKGIVRMPRSNGVWNVYQVDKQIVKIEYTYGGDPGGSIPDWIINLFIVDSPHKTLINMREYLEIKPE